MRPLIPHPSSLILLLLVLTGCGGSGLTTVSGTVKLDGKPLDGANLSFQRVGGGAVGTATSGADGSFTVMTGAQKGLAKGDYEVAVIKTGAVPATAQNVEAPPPVLTPGKYGNPKTSGLKYTVPGGPANFELLSK